MPKMTITEEEKLLILKDREIKSYQKIAWNEALRKAAELFVPNSDDYGGHEIIEMIERLKRQ